MLERKRKRDGDGPTAGLEGASGAGDAPAQQQQQQQQQWSQPPAKAQREDVPAGEQQGRLAGGTKVLRTYGQRRAKADPVTDADAPMLSPSLLKLIAGERGG